MEDGVLILYVYTNDHSKLQPSRIFPIESVEAAQLSDGTVVVGDPKLRFLGMGTKAPAIRPQRIKITRRVWLQIVVGLLLLFTIAWIAGPAPPGDGGAQVKLRP